MHMEKNGGGLYTVFLVASDYISVLNGTGRALSIIIFCTSYFQYLNLNVSCQR